MGLKMSISGSRSTRAGRVLIPRSLREQLRLGSGGTPQLESEGGEIKLRPIHSEALLKRKREVWVYRGDPCSTFTLGLIDRVRQRSRELLS